MLSIIIILSIALAIFLGYRTKINTGLFCIVFAYIIGCFVTDSLSVFFYSTILDIFLFLPHRFWFHRSNMNMNIIPVSYTHLDVYKRQSHKSIMP